MTPIQALDPRTGSSWRMRPLGSRSPPTGCRVSPRVGPPAPRLPPPSPRLLGDGASGRGPAQARIRHVIDRDRRAELAASVPLASRHSPLAQRASKDLSDDRRRYERSLCPRQLRDVPQFAVRRTAVSAAIARNWTTEAARPERVAARPHFGGSGQNTRGPARGVRAASRPRSRGHRSFARPKRRVLPPEDFCAQAGEGSLSEPLSAPSVCC